MHDECVICVCIESRSRVRGVTVGLTNYGIHSHCWKNETNIVKVQINNHCKKIP